MLAIIKKEVKSYFLSPIGYVFIGLFLLMASVFFYLNTIYSGVAYFEYMFYSLATVITFLIPVLTMRLFAEERKNGTEQLLLTSPRSITSIVLGKFISAAIVVFVAEVLTFMYYGILCYFGTPHLGTALTTLGGFFGLSLAYISFGMFASSLTENQIIAGVLSIGFFVATWFLPDIISGLDVFSIMNLFNKAPQGLIALEEIVGLSSFIFVFIILTIIVMQRRKSVK